MCCRKLLFLSLILFPAANRADELFLDAVVQASFKPERAFLIVETPEVRIYPAAFVPAHAALPDGSWRVGARCSVPGESAEVTALLLGAGEEVASVMLHTIRVKDDASLHSTDALRAELLSKKEILKSWELQYQMQEENLQRLQTDAGQIGSVAQIEESAAELERLRQQIAETDQDMAKLTARAQNAKNIPPPLNSLRRETELSRQVQELAAAAHAAEEGERLRRERFAVDIRQKLDIIAETREADEDLLREELAGLKKRRAELEAKKSAL